MGVFSFIETFFFLSLAITFILILLLVNHFKQRLNTIESKYDTLFEITNSLLQEIGSFKSYMMSGFSNRGQMMGNQPIISKSTPEVSIQDIESMSNVLHPAAERAAFFPSKNGKIVVSDNDDDETDEDDRTDGDDNGDESEVEEGYDSESSNDDDGNTDDEYDPNINFQITSEEEENMVAEPKIKIVNMDIQEPLNVDSLKDEIEGQDIESLGDLEEVVELSDEKDVIHVEKISNSEEPSTIEEVSEVENDKTVENSKDVYLKMNVHELRKVVITKGLCSDASKLKKYDLMKLLEVI